jgi:hypothetical protein
MVVNFRARGISRGARKLVRTLTLIKKKEKKRNNWNECIQYLIGTPTQCTTLLGTYIPSKELPSFSMLRAIRL